MRRSLMMTAIVGLAGSFALRADGAADQDRQAAGCEEIATRFLHKGLRELGACL